MSSSISRLAKDLYNVMSDNDRKPKARDDKAEVVEVEAEQVWVKFPGGKDPTPVQRTTNANVGDIVHVRRSGGRAWLIGNLTNPPTDDKIANKVQKNLNGLRSIYTDFVRATVGKFEYLEADTAYIRDLKADNITTDDLKANTAYIKDLTAEHITADDIVANTEYVKTLVAEDIAATDIIADHTAVGKLDADYAKINAANIDAAAIKDAWVGKLLVETGLIAHEGTVFELDAIQVNAANITAGTIDVARLIITVDGEKYLFNPKGYFYATEDTAIVQGKVYYTVIGTAVSSPIADNLASYYELVDSKYVHTTDLDVVAGKTYYTLTETAVPTPVVSELSNYYELKTYEKLHGNVIGKRTLTADKIIAGSITTEEITVENLQGTSGWINLHEGKFFYGDGATFASATNAISWNGSKLQIKADEFLLASGKSIFEEMEAVETWFYAVPPTTSNEPAVNWNTEKLKEMHLRDIYFDTESGKSYRWALTSATGATPKVYGWVEIEDVQYNALAGRVSTAETNITSNSRKIELKANSTEVYKKGEVYTKTESESLISQTADSIDLSVTQKISDIQVGGRNYLNKSNKQFDCVIGGSQYLGGVTTTIEIPSGTEITLSLDIDAKNVTWDSSANVQRIGGEINFVKDGGGYQYVGCFAGSAVSEGANIVEAFTGDCSKRIHKSFTTLGRIQAGTIFEVYSQSMATGTAIISNPKIEIGNKATDWTAAPEDKVGIDEIIARINLTPETAKIQANRVEIDGTTTFNAIKSSVENTVNTAVDGIEIGGRNLLKDSEGLGDSSWGKDFASVSNGVATLTCQSSGDNARIYQLPANGYWIWKANQSYTVSVEAKASVDGLKMYFAAYGISKYSSAISLTTEWKRYTWTAEGTSASASSMSFFVNNNSSGGTVQFRKPKLELGNKATDWTLSPEDVQAKKSVHTISSAYLTSGSTYATILGYAEEGKTITYTVLDYSSQNIKVGDSVRLAYAVSDMNKAIVYINGTVAATPSATTITITGHGLDTTIIDGGNILTNSIGANQIKANSITADKIKAGEITIGKLDNSTQTKVNNGDNAKSQLDVKDTRNDNQNPQWYITNYGTKQREVKEFKLAKTLGLSTNSSYGLLITTIPWEDPSGGWPRQTFEWNQKRYHRDGTSATAWSSWIDDGGIATTYITAIDDNGIKIHAANNPNSNYAKIDATGMDIYMGGNSVAQYGATVRIGPESTRHIKINSDGISFRSDSKDLCRINQLGSDGSTRIVSLLESGSYIALENGKLRLINNKLNSQARCCIVIDETKIALTKSAANSETYGNLLSVDSMDMTLGISRIKWGLGSTKILSLMSGYPNFQTDVKIEGDLEVTGKIKATSAVVGGQSVVSDKRIKCDITPIEDTIKSLFMQLRPVEYNWLKIGDDKRHFGLIAQEVEQVLNANNHISSKYGVVDEYSIFDEKTTYKALAYTEFIPMCIKMIQMQQEEIDKLKGAIS